MKSRLASNSSCLRLQKLNDRPPYPVYLHTFYLSISSLLNTPTTGSGTPNSRICISQAKYLCLNSQVPYISEAIWLSRVKPPYPMKAMAYRQRSSNHSAMALVTSRVGTEFGAKSLRTQSLALSRRQQLLDPSLFWNAGACGDYSCVLSPSLSSPGPAEPVKPGPLGK